jgi:hypothetical protein
VMINSPPPSADNAIQERGAIDAIVRSGPHGALALASLATLIVVIIWFIFYLFVFVPRATAL